MAETKHNPENGEFPSHGYPNLADLPEGFEVVIRRTRSGLESSVGSAMQSGDSAMDVQRKLMRPLETKHEPKASGREPEAVEEKTDHEHEPEEETVLESKRKKREKKQKGDKEAMQQWARFADKNWKKLDEKPYGRPLQAGLIGAGVGALPALYYGTGLSSLSAGAATLGLGALSLPVIGYLEGKRKKKGLQGALTGTGSGAALYYLGGGTLNALGTTIGAAALPLGLAYAGYRIGKEYKQPVVGALTGATAGILAAPVVSGAIGGASGGALTALGGAVAGIGSTAGIAAGVGLGAAGLYGLGRLNKKLGKLTFTNDNVLTTMGEGFLLPISAAWKSGEWLASKVRRKRPPEPEEATPEPAPAEQSTTPYNNEPALTPEVQKSIEYWEYKL